MVNSENYLKKRKKEKYLRKSKIEKEIFFLKKGANEKENRKQII